MKNKKMKEEKRKEEKVKIRVQTYVPYHLVTEGLIRPM